MKDARFKELLNLHLDHRLSPAEAEELDAAIRTDPVRRKALRDYEAMQSACAALFARAESRAPSSDALCRALRQAEDRIDNPRSMRDAWGWPTWGLSGGLAACVALIVARLSQPAIGTAAEVPGPVSGEGNAPVLASIGLQAAPVSAPAAAPTRTAMPRHITFAALGLSHASANADAASRWILQLEEPGMYATVEEATVAGETLQAWNRPVPAAAETPRISQFSARPINAWAQSATSGGNQLENAAYRFER